MEDRRISVLDNGYVRYIKHFGDDLDVVNSARVSYDKEKMTFDEKDARLIAFLMREEHVATLRHSAVTFEVYAPLMIVRQWHKYAVASSHVEDQLGWSESSRRYVTEKPTFYIPQATEWRTKPDNSKQGSGDPIPSEDGIWWTVRLMRYIDEGVELYESAMKSDIAAEQARLFLPAYGMYVRWRWTASLGAIIHLLNQRLERDTQKEFQLYARVVKSIMEELFPNTIKACFPE